MCPKWIQKQKPFKIRFYFFASPDHDQCSPIQQSNIFNVCPRNNLQNSNPVFKLPNRRRISQHVNNVGHTKSNIFTSLANVQTKKQSSKEKWRLTNNLKYSHRIFGTGLTISTIFAETVFMNFIFKRPHRRISTPRWNECR